MWLTFAAARIASFELLRGIALMVTRSDFVAQPSSWPAGLAESRAQGFHKTFVALCLATTQMYAIAVVIGTMGVPFVHRFTGPWCSVRHRIANMESRRATRTTARKIIILLVTPMTQCRTTLSVQTVFVGQATDVLPLGNKFTGPWRHQFHGIAHIDTRRATRPTAREIRVLLETPMTRRRTTSSVRTVFVGQATHLLLFFHKFTGPWR